MKLLYAAGAAHIESLRNVRREKYSVFMPACVFPAVGGEGGGVHEWKPDCHVPNTDFKQLGEVPEVNQLPFQRMPPIC